MFTSVTLAGATGLVESSGWPRTCTSFAMARLEPSMSSEHGALSWQWYLAPQPFFLSQARGWRRAKPRNPLHAGETRPSELDEHEVVVHVCTLLNLSYKRLSYSMFPQSSIALSADEP